MKFTPYWWKVALSSTTFAMLVMIVIQLQFWSSFEYVDFIILGFGLMFLIVDIVLCVVFLPLPTPQKPSTAEMQDLEDYAVSAGFKHYYGSVKFIQEPVAHTVVFAVEGKTFSFVMDEINTGMYKDFAMVNSALNFDAQGLRTNVPGLMMATYAKGDEPRMCFIKTDEC